jgi:hypothetical protein
MFHIACVSKRPGGESCNWIITGQEALDNEYPGYDVKTAGFNLLCSALLWSLINHHTSTRLGKHGHTDYEFCTETKQVPFTLNSYDTNHNIRRQLSNLGYK